MPKRSGLKCLAWAVYEHFSMLTGMLVFLALAMTWFPAALILHPILPRQAAARLGRAAIFFGFRIYIGFLQTVLSCRLDARALDQVRDQGPMIIVANHPSILDVVLIMSRLPNAVCVMKSSLMRNPFFGPAARMAGYVRNDVPLNMILECKEVLQCGGQVVVFPEGTRTQHFPINDLSPVIALMAQRCKVPIQTVMIDCSEAYLGKTYPIFKPPSLPLIFQLRLGQSFDAPVQTAGFTAMLKQHFVDQLTARAEDLPLRRQPQPDQAS